MKYKNTKISKFREGGLSKTTEKFKKLDPRKNDPEIKLVNLASNSSANRKVIGPTSEDIILMKRKNEGEGIFSKEDYTFKEAFAKARQMGLKEFEYGKGNRIAVVLADDPVKAPASAPVDNTTYISNTTLPEVVVTGRARPNSSVRNDTTYLSNTPLSELVVTGTAPVRNDTTYVSNTPLQEVVVTAPRTVKPVKQSW